MVSVSYASKIDRSDRLIQSVDLAIRDLLATNDDPLSMSAYLWSAQQQKLPLINSDRLARWGMAWIHQIFIEGQIGRRMDEDIASASLAVISLHNTGALLKTQEELREKIADLLGAELDRQRVPLLRASYGAMFLLAAHILGVRDIRITTAATEIALNFKESISGGRLFGIAYCMLLLKELKEEALLVDLEQNVIQALHNPAIFYEDQAYLLQALWILRDKCALHVETIEQTQTCLSRSPVWAYLMNGDETIDAAGDQQTVIPISHLYRAALLEILSHYQSREAVISEQHFRERYAGRKGIGISALSFFIFVALALSAPLLYMIVVSSRGAWRFWIKHDYSAMPIPLAVLFPVGLIFTLYFIHLSIKGIRALYVELVVANVQSDRRIKEILLPIFSRVSMFWLKFSIGVVVALLINFVMPSLERAVNNK